MKPTTPDELYAARHSVPGELRDADWGRLPLYLRERSYWMAGVANAEILQEFRDKTAAILRGDLSETEARARLRLFLDQVGYTPEPGQEGTIKDLRSVRRMKVALGTNVRMMQGKAMWERYRGSLVFPALELVRVEERVEKRDWQTRWNNASAAYGEEVSNYPMIAPHGHRIWTDISEFDVPWPPYAYGSGMGIKGVKRDDAEKHINPDWTPDAATEVEPSLNSTLERTAAVRDKDLRDALSEHLQGYARWEGNKLIFTDPNGTRPSTGEELAEVWQKGLPAQFENHQQGVFLDWVEDSRRFHAETGLLRLRPGSNGWQDFQRLVRRLKNPVQPETLWRGIRLKREELETTLNKWQAAGYAVRDVSPAESWTGSLQAALNYAAGSGRGQRWGVILEYQNPGRAKDITALVRALEQKINKKKVPTVSQDAEWLLPRGVQLEVSKIKRNTSKRQVTITLTDK